jgi:hypothetical protein
MRGILELLLIDLLMTRFAGVGPKVFRGFTWLSDSRLFLLSGSEAGMDQQQRKDGNHTGRDMLTRSSSLHSQTPQSTVGSPNRWTWRLSARICRELLQALDEFSNRVCLITAKTSDALVVWRFACSLTFCDVVHQLRHVEGRSF